MVKWENVELGKYAEIYRGGSPRPIQVYLTTREDGVNWIKIGDVAPNAKYINSTEEKIIPEGICRSRVVSKGDFLLSNSMSFGRPYILNISGCIHDGWLTIQNYNDSFDTDFLYYFLSSEITLRQYHAMAAGSSVQNLNKEKVAKVLVTKPPLLEQRAIADALSDVDGYISTLELLIDKKRNIKKAVMQELLTGKRRLPGFSGEWVETLLGEIGSFSKGKGISKADAFSGSIPCIRYGEIYTVHHNFIKTFSSYISTEVATKSRQINQGDLLFTGSGETKAEIGKCVAFTSDCLAYAGGDIIILSPFKNYDSLFFGYYLNSNRITAQKADRGQGDAIVHINIPSLAEIDITIPPTKLEQSAIASVLSDMDSEIDALTAKLDKIRNIKQGMMQELLTGRIRLVTDEAKPAMKTKGHTPEFDDAIMIAGIVDAVYSDKYPLGRKKLQKYLYLLRRHQKECTAAFKKKAAGPYADEVRYKGGEPTARKAKYIVTTTVNGKGTTFAPGTNISQALDYIQKWDYQADIKWLVDNLKYKKVDDLELLATVDMAICDLKEEGIPVSLKTIKNLIATNAEWKGKLDKEIFSDLNIARAMKELKTLL
jgi:type I restriction enzyme S subunit